MTTRERLIVAAEWVYGPEWVRPLGRLLAVDPRTVRRWKTGEAPTPPAAVAVLVHLAWVRGELRKERRATG